MSPNRLGNVSFIILTHVSELDFDSVGNPLRTFPPELPQPSSGCSGNRQEYLCLVVSSTDDFPINPCQLAGTRRVRSKVNRHGVGMSHSRVFALSKLR